MKRSKKKEKRGYLSMELDAEVDSLVNEYASMRKVGRAPAIRQFLNDNLPLHIHNLRQACQQINRSPMQQ